MLSLSAFLVLYKSFRNSSMIGILYKFIHPNWPALETTLSLHKRDCNGGSSIRTVSNSNKLIWKKIVNFFAPHMSVGNRCQMEV